MFWGLIIEPKKRYTQTVEKAFHLSMAALDATTAGENVVQIMLFYEGRNYLLCSLQKDSVLQTPLDLNFEEGSKVSFMSNGEGHVHLTGYLIPENDDLEEFDDEEEDEDEEIEDVPELVGQKKRKALDSLKAKESVKKAKKQTDEEESSESESLNLLTLASDMDSEDDEDYEVGEEDSNDDEIDDSDAEEEDDSEDENDDSDEEVEEPKPVALTKKQKKDKEKHKNMNGKASSQEKEQVKNLNGHIQESEKKQKKNKEDKKSLDKPEQQQNQLQKKKIEGGVQIEDLTVGSGAVAKPGKFATVYYVGKLKNGKKFDQTKGGEGFKFRLGKGEVIKGWDLGIVGMKVGGKRRISIPPAMGYGNKGSPPVIPPNSFLTFDVELRNIN